MKQRVENSLLWWDRCVGVARRVLRACVALSQGYTHALTCAGELADAHERVRGDSRRAG
jgi:hypothetical protein